METWKPIVGHEECYMVSSHGRIMSMARKVICKGGYRSVRERYLKTGTGSTGYPKVQLKKGGSSYNVHRLVAEAFIDRPEWATQVNHIDGVKTNNRVENLEWVNQSINQKHAYSIGLQKPFSISGSMHWMARSVVAERVSGELVGRWECVADCARDLNIRYSSVCRVLRGIRRVYAGMVFKYTD